MHTQDPFKWYTGGRHKPAFPDLKPDQVCISLIGVVLCPCLQGLLRSMRRCHRLSHKKKAFWHSTSLGVWTELAHICLWLTYAKQTHEDGLTPETV